MQAGLLTQFVGRTCFTVQRFQKFLVGTKVFVKIDWGGARARDRWVTSPTLSPTDLCSPMDSLHVTSHTTVSAMMGDQTEPSYWYCKCAVCIDGHSFHTFCMCALVYKRPIWVVFQIFVSHFPTIPKSCQVEPFKTPKLYISPMCTTILNRHHKITQYNLRSRASIPHYTTLLHVLFGVCLAVLKHKACTPQNTTGHQSPCYACSVSSTATA